MSLFDVPIGAIKEADLQAIIGEAEGKVLDFKRDPVGKTDADRKEFLYDVSSFANTSGGDLVFGIAETDGLASGLLGLTDLVADDEINRLETMARDGIRPPIAGLETRAVALAAGGFALVMRIPKSWTPPHQVTFQKAFRFYARDTNGKYQIDVDGLRAAFVASTAIGEQLRSYRADRLARLLSGDSPAPLQEGAKVVLQVVPFSAMSAAQGLPLAAVAANDRLFPTWTDRGGRNVSVTFDGVVATPSASPPPAPQRAYTLVTRAGAVEAVNNLHQYEALPELQAKVIDHALRYARSLEQLGVHPPYAVFVSLARCRGLRLVHDFKPSGALPEDLPCGILGSDHYAAVETVWEVLPQDGAEAAALLRGTLDHLANAAGLPTAPYFDATGRYQLKA